MNKFTFKNIHIVKATSNIGNKTIHNTEDTLMFIKISESHLQIFFIWRRADDKQVKFGKETDYRTHLLVIGYIPQPWIWDWKILNFGVGVSIILVNF